MNLSKALSVPTVLIHVALIYRALHWYPLLPDPFPIHFNGAGVPDGWAAKSPVAWALIPGIGLLLVLGLGALGRYTSSLAVRSPGLFNVPDKARFLAMDEAGRRAVARPMATYLQWVSMLIAGLFLYIVEGIGRVATGMAPAHPSWPVLLFLAGVLGGLPLLIRATNNAMRKGR